jgi:hypothetical protein
MSQIPFHTPKDYKDWGNQNPGIGQRLFPCARQRLNSLLNDFTLDSRKHQTGLLGISKSCFTIRSVTEQAQRGALAYGFDQSAVTKFGMAANSPSVKATAA